MNDIENGTTDKTVKKTAAGAALDKAKAGKISSNKEERISSAKAVSSKIKSDGASNATISVKPRAGKSFPKNSSASAGGARVRKSIMSGPIVTVRKVRSEIRQPNDQKRTLISLGLKKMNSQKTLPDVPSVRGMIAKVAHLIQIVEE